MNPWIGFNLDGTLALTTPGESIYLIGEPIIPMINLLKSHLEAGIECRIVTARVAATEAINSSGVTDSKEFASKQVELIKAWCLQYIGCELPVTASKDFGMIRLFDDRVIQVETNTGRLITGDKGELP